MDEWLNDIFLLGFHQLESLVDLLEPELVSRHPRWVNSPAIDQSKQALQAESTTGAQSSDDILLSHADTPVLAGNMDTVTLSMVAHVRDRPARLRDRHTLFRVWLVPSASIAASTPSLSVRSMI